MSICRALIPKTCCYTNSNYKTKAAPSQVQLCTMQISHFNLDRCLRAPMCCFNAIANTFLQHHHPKYGSTSPKHNAKSYNTIYNNTTKIYFKPHVQYTINQSIECQDVSVLYAHKTILIYSLVCLCKQLSRIDLHNLNSNKLF